jgi:hypothetical protein
MGIIYPHYHLDYFGSEICCEKCNPICGAHHRKLYQEDGDYLKWCGLEKCPCNPRK